MSSQSHQSDELQQLHQLHQLHEIQKLHEVKQVEQLDEAKVKQEVDNLTSLRHDYSHCYLKHGTEPEACTEENILVRPAALENACWVFNEILALHNVSIKELSNTVHCQIVYPDDVEYNTVRLNYNKEINVFPAACVLVRNTNNIANTIAFATKYNIPFRIRSGKHAQVAASVINLGIVIDTSNMNKILLLNDHKCIVQSGILLGPLEQALSEKNKLFPVGTCATNGLAGFTLGGGFGLLQRKYGLAIDNLLALTFVDANGNVKRLSHDSQHDNDLLLAAFKGAGGGNFGVVTLFEFKVYNIPKACAFSYYFDRSSIQQVFDIFQDNKFVNNVTMDLVIVGKTEPILISGVYIPDNFNDSNDDIVQQCRCILTPFDCLTINTHVETMTNNQLCQWMSAGSYARPPYFLIRTTFAERRLPQTAIDTIIKRMNLAETTHGISFLLMGGVIPNVKSYQTAFPYRDSKFWVQIFTRWDNQSLGLASKAWVDQTLYAITPYLVHYQDTIPLYVNFLDYNLSREQALTSYYRDNVHWLQLVKHVIDPNNVFNFEQSL